MTSYRTALHEGLRDVLQNVPNSFLIGEDVGKYGGTYAVSKDFLTEFGEERVRDTPLSESVFTGVGIGAALGGMRPIVEIMTVNFSLLAMDQIMNNAATLRHMSGGQLTLPVTIRMATGAGRQLAAQHSHGLEGWFAHIPCLKIITPATITDARYMLQAAVNDPNPVILFEQSALYNMDGEIEDISAVDISQARILKEGNDLSLISYGAGTIKALEAANLLKDISVEVIDLRILRPLDEKTILQSVRKTHRAVIVDEGWCSGSISAEISARINENVFYELDAPVKRVCSKEVPMPYAAQLEKAVMPQIETITQVCKDIFHDNI